MAQVYASDACYCNPGYYGLSSQISTLCQKCPVNTYKTSVSNGVASSVCRACPTNSTTNAIQGVSSIKGCVCIEPYVLTVNVCVQAPPGMAYDGNGSFVCKENFFPSASGGCEQCANNTYKWDAGNYSCLPLPPYSEPDGGGGFNCFAGYEYDREDDSTSCVPCADGTYKPTTELPSCLPLPPYSVNNGTTDFICVNDTYVNTTSSNYSCVPVPPGTVSDEQNGYTCDVGMYMDSLAETCVNCPPNMYKETLGMTCTACPNSLVTANPSEGATSLLDCVAQPGSYWDASANVSLPCPKDTYKSDPGNTPCVSCGFNRGTGSLIAQNLLSACQCVEGHYLLGDQCVACEENTYKDFGNATSCIACPWGSTTNGVVRSTSISACVPKMHYAFDSNSQLVCAIDSEPRGDNCVGCNPGYYKSSDGNFSCAECSQLQTTEGTSCNASAQPTDQNAQISSSSNKSNFPIGAVVGASIGVIASVLVAILAAVLVKKQKKKQGKATSFPKLSPTQRLKAYDRKRNNFENSSSMLPGEWFSTRSLAAKNNNTLGGVSISGAVSGPLTSTHTHMIASGTETRFGDIALAYPAFLEINSSFGLRKVSTLSSGGFGCVYISEIMDMELAQTMTRSGLSKNVAHKVMITKSNPTADDLRALEDSYFNEATLMYACQFSPFIARLIAVSREPEYGLAMKLYDGNLFELAHANSDNELLNKALGFVNNSYVTLMTVFASQLSCALADIHGMSIVHLDIKPANCLVERMQSPSKVSPIPFKIALADFGMSRITNDAITVKGRDRKLANGLSLNYCAPEAFQVVRLLNSNSELQGDPLSLEKMDIFSYGSTLYEMFTRTVPFQQLHASEIEHSLVAGKRPDWSAAKDYPRSQEDVQLLARVRELVESCWSGHPCRRPTAKVINESFYDISSIIEPLD